MSRDPTNCLKKDRVDVLDNMGKQTEGEQLDEAVEDIEGLISDSYN